MLVSDERDEDRVEAEEVVESETAPSEQVTREAAAALDTRPASVTARIVDSAGNPIEGAELLVAHRIQRGQSSPAGISDAAGEVRLDVPWYMIEHCFPQSSSSLVRADGWATTGSGIHIRRPEQKHLGTITLVAGGSATGRVVDSSGRGVADVPVHPKAAPMSTSAPTV